MKPLFLTTVIGLTALLAACGGEPPTKEEATDNMGGMMGNMSSEMGNMANHMDNMGNMAMPAAPTARGTGTVTAIDKAAGTITLSHGPIPEANWPAMTMAFKSQPKLLDSVKVGDKVSFELALKDGAGEVTAIQKQ